VVDRGGWWWRELAEGVELVEEDDGTFTLTARPVPDLTDPTVLAAVLAQLRRRGYTITGPAPFPPE
jgi:hypothetical protein